MLQSPNSLARAVAKGLSLVLLIAVAAALVTAVMMRCAPGYFSDERELDSRYGNAVRQQLQAEQQQSGVFEISKQLALRWVHLDFGRSRTWDIPVFDIVRERSIVSVRLLALSLPLSWFLTAALALPFSARSAAPYDLITTAFTSLALAVPAGALATVCIVAGCGGPALVLTVLLMGRQFRFLQTMLQQAWAAHHVVVARGFGASSSRLLRRNVLPQIIPQLVPLTGMSVMTALAALVPVEVIFDQPGLGKLAWQSCMNRDLPVLAAVTLLFAGCVAMAGAISNGVGVAESAPA